MRTYTTILSIQHHRKYRSGLALMLLSFFALGLISPVVAGWHFEIGPIYRGGMDVEMSGSSHTQQSGIQAAGGARRIPGLADVPWVPPVGDNPDDITQIGNRDFDDGFVYMDAETEIDDFTVNWGYLYADQYNADAGTLTFVRTTYEGDVVTAGTGEEFTRSIRTDMDSGIGEDASFDGWGLRADARYDLTTWRDMDVAFTVGIRGFWGMEKSLGGSTFRQTVTERTAMYVDSYIYYDEIEDTYLYDTGGEQIPPAPYWNPDGDPADDPLINNIPLETSRESSRSGSVVRTVIGTRSSTWSAENRIELDFKSDLYQVALGGQLSGVIGDRTELSLRPALLLNIAEVSAARREEFVRIDGPGRETRLASWRDRESSSEFLFGAGLEAALTFRVNENWFIGVSGGYEWVDTASITVGPNTLDIDYSAYTASAVFGRDF